MEFIDSTLPSFLKDSGCTLKCLVYFIIFIGAIYVVKMLLGLVSLINRQFIRKPLDLIKTYGGQDSWAVVTGGSDGVGLQFCKDLAKLGFNICIISRTESKIQEKLQEISKNCGKQIKTRAIVADLSKMTKIEEYEKLATKLSDIDIGMLLLNAGWTQTCPFIDLTPEQIEYTVNINALHPAYLSKVLIKQLQARTQRSAIIITSSGLAGFPASGAITYSASKAFSSFLGQGLNYELKDKIDVMSYELGETRTKLLGSRKSPMVIEDVRIVTKACLRDIGRESLTYGALKHELSMLLIGVLPLKMLQSTMYKASLKVRDRIRAKEAAEKKAQ
eukprot:403367310